MSVMFFQMMINERAIITSTHHNSTVFHKQLKVVLRKQFSDDKILEHCHLLFFVPALFVFLKFV